MVRAAYVLILQSYFFSMLYSVLPPVHAYLHLLHFVPRVVLCTHTSSHNRKPVVNGIL
jgi:hypothetical protein